GAVGDLGEVVHHDRLAAPGCALGDRYCCPHARVELATELLDEALLVLGELRIALGEHHLALARHQAEKLHGGEDNRSARGADRVSGGTASSPSRLQAGRPMPSTSTGPGPRPMSRSPSRTASEAIRFAARAASSGSWPSARW